jgi:chromosome segregation ATPase
LLYEMDDTSTREREWRSTVERLSKEVQKLESQISSRERDQTSHLRNLEVKNSSLIADLTFLKDDNAKLKDRLKHLESLSLQAEQKFHTADMRVQEAVYGLEEQRRQATEARAQIRKREDEVHELQETLLMAEAQKVREIEDLRVKLDEVREANGHLSTMYESQIVELRNRLVTDKKKTEGQADQIINLT